MKLTPELLRQNAEAMIAHADGKPVQFFDDGFWKDVPEPQWDFPNIRYRPKPEPVTRPWGPDEMRGKWVRYKGSGNDYLIHAIVDGKARMLGLDAGYSPDRLLELFTQLDGSPCGVTEP